MSRRISVRAVVVHEGKLLCVRLNQYNDLTKAAAVDWWCTPGGGLDYGEGLVQGLEREMLEETGVPAQVGNLLYIQQFMHSGEENLEFFFHVTNADDYINIDLSKTTHGEHEIAEIGFVDPAQTNILPKFLTTEPLTEKIANNGPPTIFNFL